MRSNQELLSCEQPLDEIYHFCIARARERAVGQGRRSGRDEGLEADSAVQTLRDVRRDMFDRPWTAADGLDFFRTYALRDRDHPDYRPEWAPA